VLRPSMAIPAKSDRLLVAHVIPRVVAEFVGCVFLTVEPNREALVIDLSGGVGCIAGRRDCRAPSQGDGALLIET
jgi:hypothetical protein